MMDKRKEAQRQREYTAVEYDPWLSFWREAARLADISRQRKAAKAAASETNDEPNSKAISPQKFIYRRIVISLTHARLKEQEKWEKITRLSIAGFQQTNSRQSRVAPAYRHNF